MTTASELGSPAKGRYGIRNFGFLVCLLAACLLWLSQRLSQTIERQRAIDLVYELADDLAFDRQPPSTIRATLRGPGLALLMQSQRPVVTIPIVNPEQVSLSAGDVLPIVQEQIGSFATIIDIKGIPLHLALSERAFKRVPLRLRHPIQTAEGYGMPYGIRLSPDSIQLAGSHTLLASYAHWPIENDSLAPLFQSLSQEFPIGKPKALLELSAEQCSVDVVVDQFTEKSVFPLIRVPMEGALVIPNKAEVIFHVPLSRFDDFDATDFVVGTDTMIQSDMDRYKAKLILEKNPISSWTHRMIPDSVEVIVEMEKGR